MHTKPRYVPQIDGLRALAAMAVVVHHIPLQVGVGGYIGVDVFFVLSGFLITQLLCAEASGTGGIDLRQFYVRRLRRLTPALVLCALVVVQAFLVVAAAPDKHDTAVGGLLAVSYLGSWAKAFGWASLGWLAHTWSLSVEEHFYLLWPLLVRRVRNRLGRLLNVAVGLFALSSALAVFGAVRGWSVDRLVFAPDTRAKDLLAGCVLALVLQRVPHIAPRAGVGAASLAVLAGWALFVPKESTLYLFGWPVVLAASVALVWVLATNDGSRVSRVLARPDLVWIGKRSYGLYLWSFPLTLLNAAVVDWSAPGRVLVAFGTVGTAMLLAAWSYRYVEEPIRHQAYGPVSVGELRDYIHHMLRRRRSTRTSSAGNTAGSSTPSWSRRKTYPSSVAFSTTKPLAQRPSSR